MNKIIYCFLCFFAFINLLGAAIPESRKKAIIFGVTGQDGTYLTELLLSKNYDVHGVARHSSLTGTSQLTNFNDGSHYFFHSGDITNFSHMFQLIGTIQPDEIYNLAAQSQVKISFDLPEETANINALGTLRILEAIKMLGLEKKVKYFQASSSELFGFTKESESQLSEKSPFHPRSPYGVAKLYGYWIAVNYRESYGIFTCNGILFNHESPIRGNSFVTRKITMAASRIKLGVQQVLCLGNLDAKRDWGYAKDYVEAMWLMLQQDQPDDYVIATGESHSVRDFVETAFKFLDIDIEWHGEGVEEYGINRGTGDIIVKIDPSYYRPNEIDFALGNPEKAEKILKWRAKTSFKELVEIMIKEDLKKVTHSGI